jgi:hypothetical protein
MTREIRNHSETIQHTRIATACRVLAQGDYTHRHNQVANTVPL